MREHARVSTSGEWCACERASARARGIVLRGGSFDAACQARVRTLPRTLTRARLRMHTSTRTCARTRTSTTLSARAHLFAAMLAQSFLAATSMAVASGCAREHSPVATASSAPTTRAVSDISVATPWPTMLGRRCNVPTSAAKPTSTSCSRACFARGRGRTGLSARACACAGAHVRTCASRACDGARWGKSGA